MATATPLVAATSLSDKSSMDVATTYTEAPALLEVATYEASKEQSTPSSAATLFTEPESTGVDDPLISG